MYKSKKYCYSWEDYDNGKNAETLISEILEDKELKKLEEIIIGDWGESYDDSCQSIIDDIIENKEKFTHIKSLFIGDMEYDECEVSWIVQGNYGKLWSALPNLKELRIKGSNELDLGEINHENLEVLEIICGGLPKSVISQIEKAKLPNLKKLNLYLGINCYGFDGDINTIKGLLEHSNFPNLIYLGLNDSYIQDEVTEAILHSKYISQIGILDLSNGVLTDKGGQMLLEEIPKYNNIEKLDLHYHYLSNEMMEKLDEFSIEIDLSEQNELELWDGRVFSWPMLTE